MEPERDEIYDRIPWETLEPAGASRQWLVYAAAAALVLGALAYSFTRNQSPTPASQAAEPAATSTIPATTATTAAAPTPSTAADTVVVAEADLFAVDPERLIDLAAAHAEWFAVEYVSFDGDVESGSVLEALLPLGTPLPQAPDGIQVFVDWAGATAVAQTGPSTFDVDVVVRSLVARDDSAFTRQPPQHLMVPIELDGEGRPRVSRPPVLEERDPAGSAELALQEVPAGVAENLSVEGEVVGGVPGANGGWLVVIFAPGPDGVTRPVTVEAPAIP